MSSIAFQALEDDDIESLKHMVNKKHIQIQQFVNKNGNTLLMEAVKEDSDSLMELIPFLVLLSEPNLQQQNKDGNTLLHLAVLNGDVDVIQTLFEFHQIYPIVNIQNKNKYTAFHLAIKEGYEDIALFLLMTAKSDFEIVSKKEWRPLHMAAQADMNDLVKVLMWMGADINALTKSGETAYDIAIQNDNTLVAETLLKEISIDALRIKKVYKNRKYYFNEYEIKSRNYLTKLENEDKQALYHSFISQTNGFLHSSMFRKIANDIYATNHGTVDTILRLMKLIMDAPALPISQKVYIGTFFEKGDLNIGSKIPIIRPFVGSIYSMLTFGKHFITNQYSCCLLEVTCSTDTKCLYEPDNNAVILPPCYLRIVGIRKMYMNKLSDTQKKIYVQKYLQNATIQQRKSFLSQTFKQSIKIYKCVMEPIELKDTIVPYKSSLNTKYDLDIYEKHLISISSCVKDASCIDIMKDSPQKSLKIIDKLHRIIGWYSDSLPAERRTAFKLETLYHDTMKYLGKNQKIPNKLLKSDTIRVLTMNVHMWMDVFKYSQKTEILKTLKQVNADVACLQEIQYKNQEEINRMSLEAGYNNEIHVETANYFDLPFGNMIFSKKLFSEHRIITLGLHMKEKRSAIYIKYKSFHIYCLHLDVYDKFGKERMKELEILFNDINKLPKDEPIIVCGDFNSIRKRDYPNKEWDVIVAADKSRRIDTLDELGIFDNYGFVSAFEGSDILNNGSAWSHRIIDFMFVKNVNVLRREAVYTNISDHIPLYIDLQPKI